MSTDVILGRRNFHHVSSLKIFSFSAPCRAMTGQQEYRLSDASGFDSIKLQQGDIPRPNRGEIQIKFHAAGLNFRDLIISKGSYPFPLKQGTVPASDGAGEVTEVGEDVTAFKVGDRVMPNFNQDHIGGKLTSDAINSGLGGGIDGCLREYGVFRALSCVKAPKNLSWEELATLPCAALTAWRGLVGSVESPLKAGQWVLLQGTGGVSVFGAQFALAAGCNVIITSSSDEKLSVVKKLGERVHTINYSETPEWGVRAKEITGGRGVDHILEVGGEKTFLQSLEALVLGGSICIIGFIARKGASSAGAALIGGILGKNANVRGILVGSVEHFNDMNAAIETHNIKPIVDKVFEFKDVKEAYQYQWDQKHVGKVVIKIGN